MHRLAQGMFWDVNRGSSAILTVLNHSGVPHHNPGGPVGRVRSRTKVELLRSAKHLFTVPEYSGKLKEQVSLIPFHGPACPTAPNTISIPRGNALRTEQEIARSWSGLFNGQDLNDSIFAQAEELIDSLRPESPLRHRLDAELTELRAMAS